jgi:hypothetical protein
MNRNIFQIIFLLVILISLIIDVEEAQTQWYYSLYLEQEYNSNPFGFPEAEQDQISRFSMGLRKDWESISVQYFGSYLNFHQHNRRNFYWQQFSLIYASDKTSLNFTAENRIDRSDYNIYDYFTVRGGFSRALTSGQLMWRLNGTVAVNTFQNFSELDNLFFAIFTTLNRSFKTRTSIIANLSLNLKSYLEKDLNPILPEDSSTVSSEALSLVYNSISGPGPGKGGGRDGHYQYYVPDVENSMVSQLYLSIRVAQSVTKYTGLALQYQNRLNISQQDRSVAGLIYGYTAESQIFDDPMGYQGQTVGAQLTQILPFQISLKTAFYYQQKNYISQGIYLDTENFTENTLRDDINRMTWLTVEKKFPLNFIESGGIGLSMNYQWVNNHSNSYWYQYESQFWSVALQLDI